MDQQRQLVDHEEHPVAPPRARRQAARPRAARAALGGDDGQAAVELALVLPLLVMVVTALVQLGITLNHYVALTDAVRVAARAAAVAGGSQAAAQTALQDAAGGLPVTLRPVGVTGTDVTVTATTPYSIGVFGLPLTTGVLSSTTTERME